MKSPIPHGTAWHWLVSSRRRRWFYVWLACSATVGAAIYSRAHDTYVSATLVRSWPVDILKNPTLLHFAAREGPDLYRQYCASCHGARLEGDPLKGAPNLLDGVWLYGAGSISDIETTITYGIRSGHPKAHNLADMPALGRSGQLSQQDVRDVTEYLLLLSQQPHNALAAARGREIFRGAGVCYDCHASDADGISDYGSPPLTGREGSWLYGGDRKTLYKSIYDGRHGLCPAWIGRLNFAEIRILSVYLYETSHHE